MTSPEVFRILVLDNETSIHEIVKDALEFLGSSVKVDYARNPEEAAALISRSLYDLAILDLRGDADIQIGTEVYRRIDAARLSTRVLLMTQFELKDDARHLIELASSSSAWRLVGFLDKQETFNTALRSQVDQLVRDFSASRASIEGLDGIADHIKRHRHRYRNGQGEIILRSDKSEIGAEVERLIRGLYVELPGGANRKSHVNIALKPVENPGLSAAVVSNATVELRFDMIDRKIGGHKTILKIGPKADIMEEAARYSEYVRYGVELAQRVELLAVSGVDALGGLVYSFAGGLHNNELRPLDEVLINDLNNTDISLSNTILDLLFKKTNWYSVAVGPQDIGSYFRHNYKTNVRRSGRDGEARLLEIGKHWRNTGPYFDKVERSNYSYMEVSTSTGTMLRVPDTSVLGWGVLLYQAPGCLVHGDMHGGNVLSECSSEPARPGAKARTVHHRTCLIDFRNAGPGPRSIDAVCLESTIRLADARAASSSYAEYAAGDADLIPVDLANAMIDRFEEEKALYRAIFLNEGSIPDADWARLSATVLHGLLGCFDGLSLREYLATSIRYTIRGLGFRMKDAFRLRMCAWLGAQYELAKELAQK